MTVAEILLAHNVPLRFEPALADYAATGKLSGVELKCRMNSLSNYKAAREQIDKEFNIGRSVNRIPFTHAFHPDFADAGLDGDAQADRGPAPAGSQT